MPNYKKLTFVIPTEQSNPRAHVSAFIKAAKVGVDVNPQNKTLELIVSELRNELIKALAKQYGFILRSEIQI